jgi:hypothetical protein
MARTAVYLEVGTKKVFACALDWPGWARARRTEEAALEALAEYAPRYAVVAQEAGVRFPRNVADVFDVVERVPGDASTDFGVIGKVPAADSAPVSAATARRLATLLRAAWTVFDKTVAETPAELRKGPRGGGRDRDKMVQHVIESEAGYARYLGIKRKPPTLDDRAAIEALRADLAAVIGTASDGSPVWERGWPTRYAARRLAWHALDHAWEMQDRSR